MCQLSVGTLPLPKAPKPWEPGSLRPKKPFLCSDSRGNKFREVAPPGRGPKQVHGGTGTLTRFVAAIGCKAWEVGSPRPWAGGQALAGASVGSASVSPNAQGTRASRGAVPSYQRPQRPARADTVPWRPRASSQPAAGPGPSEGAAPGRPGARTSERPYPAAGSAGLGLHPRHLTPLATRYVASASLWVSVFAMK